MSNKWSYLITISALSLLAAAASAQTCATPPSCDELGYSKTAADCEGQDYLKCPFDQSKVYCYRENYIDGLHSYKVGDPYYYDGILIGQVIRVDNTGKHGSIINIQGREFENSADWAAYCDKYRVANRVWQIASEGDFFDDKVTCETKFSLTNLLIGESRLFLTSDSFGKYVHTIYTINKKCSELSSYKSERVLGFCVTTF